MAAAASDERAVAITTLAMETLCLTETSDTGWIHLTKEIPTIESTAALVTAAIAEGTLDQALRRLPENAKLVWPAVIERVLDTTPEHQTTHYLEILLLETAKYLPLCSTTWEAAADWAISNSDEAMVATMASVWHPGYPTEWHAHILKWGVESDRVALCQTLLLLDIPLPETPPFGHTPLTLYVAFEVTDRAIDALSVCSRHDLEGVPRFMKPLFLALATHNDAIAAAVVRRYGELEITPQSRNTLNVAISGQMEETVKALIDIGACLARKDVPAEDTALYELIMRCDHTAKLAIRAAVSGRGIDEQNPAALLAQCGRRFLLDCEDAAFARLFDSGEPLPKSVADQLLTSAIYLRRPSAIRLCRQAGVDANTRCLGVFDPVAYATFRGVSEEILSELDGLDSDNDHIATEAIQRKVVAHAWDLDGSTSVGGSRMKLAGSFPHVFYSPLLRAIEAELETPKRTEIELTILAEIKQMVEQLQQAPSTAETAEAIQNGKPQIVHMGGYRHIAAGVFMDDTYFLCNIGAHSLEPVEAFVLPREIVTETLLDEIAEYETRPLAEAMTYLRRFPEKRGFGPDVATTAHIKDHWLGKTKQKVGNCALESLLTAVELYIVQRMVPVDADPKNCRLLRTQARSLARHLRQSLMVQTVVDYIHSHDSIRTHNLMDNDLLERVAELAESLPAAVWSESQRRKLELYGLLKPTRRVGFRKPLSASYLRQPEVVPLTIRGPIRPRTPEVRPRPPSIYTPNAKGKARDSRMLYGPTRHAHNGVSWRSSRRNSESSETHEKGS